MYYIIITDNWCFTATFVHMLDLMGEATCKGNEAKSKMKHHLDMNRSDSNTDGNDLWSNTLPLDQGGTPM